MAKAEHDFHLVNPSPLPIVTAFSLMTMLLGSVLVMHKHHLGYIVLTLGVASVIICVYKWWGAVIREAKVDKAHTALVRRGLSWGMLLFITSEAMFFLAFFWSFFHAWLLTEPMVQDFWTFIPTSWPPAHIQPLDPWDIPLINTVILLLSGATVTWAHFELLKGNNDKLVKGLLSTVLLGATFSLLQVYEYFHATFKFTDGVYPSNFYMATGFHGAHVLIGTIFLLVCLVRARKGDFDPNNNHLGFEFATWYWHFVDVVWLFLYAFIYVLAS